MLDIKTEVDLGKLNVALNLPKPMFFPSVAVKPSAEVLLNLRLEILAKYSEKSQKLAILLNTCCPKDQTASVRLLESRNLICFSKFRHLLSSEMTEAILSAIQLIHL